MKPHRRGLAVGDRIELREPAMFGEVRRRRFIVFSVRSNNSMRTLYSCRGRHAVRPRPALSGRRPHHQISA
jgi:hypothetical protein